MDYKFGSIESFAKMYKKNGDYFKADGNLIFVLKPKIHGTNGSILVTKDKYVEYRSKNRVLTVGDDHFGFALAMSKHNDAWRSLIDDYPNALEILIMGEWAGPGIQKSDAVSSISDKTFFIFSVMIKTKDSEFVLADLETVLNKEVFSSNVRVLPVVKSFETGLSYEEDISEVVELINKEVAQYETEDPYIKNTFGISGTGEGIVGTLLTSNGLGQYFTYAFKAKTEAHRVNTSTAPAVTREPLPQEAIQFAEKYITYPRILQALSELQLEPDMRNTSDVIKWVMNDVIKEANDDIIEMGVDWKSLSKVCTRNLMNKWKIHVENFERV